eukprot:scaffold38892_cov32-Tisochrysis_lutea.AAC.5
MARKASIVAATAVASAWASSPGRAAERPAIGRPGLGADWFAARCPRNHASLHAASKRGTRSRVAPCSKRQSQVDQWPAVSAAEVEDRRQGLSL